MRKMDKHVIYQYLLSGLIIALLGFFGTRFMKVTDELPVLQERLKTLVSNLEELKEISKQNAIRNEEQIKRLSDLHLQIEIIKQKIETLNKIHKLKWELSRGFDETGNVQQPAR